MKPRNRGLIVIHRGDRWFGRMRRYRVSIDNRPSGSVARIGPTEFSVDPGVHTVEVAMDWGHSLPLRLEVAPGSRTDLRVARRPWSFLKASAPAIIFIIVANLIASLLRHTSNLSEMGLLGLFGVLLTSFCVTLVAILILRLLFKDFWVLFLLEPMIGSDSGSPSSAIP
jgi:hypothetical protein